MSLINQMLKDLDSRRGPADGAELAALHSMGLSGANQLQWHRAIPYAAWLLGGILVLALVLQSWPLWIGEQAGAVLQTGEQQTDQQQHPVENDGAARPASRPAETARENSAIAAESLGHDSPGDSELAVPALPATTDMKPGISESVSTAPEPEPQAAAVSAGIEKLTPEQRTERLLTEVQRALDQQQARRAERLLRTLLDNDPSHIAARTRLAAVLVKQGRVTEGEQLLAQGLLVQPHRLELARPYARLLAARGELEPALEMLDRSVDPQRPDAESQGLRAAILYRMKRYGESIAAYRQALHARPEQALWWTGLAVALEQDHQAGQALQAYLRALDLPLEKPVHAYVKQRIQALNNPQTLY